MSGSRSSRSGLPEKPGSSAGSRPDRSKSSISSATGHACRSTSHASPDGATNSRPAGIHIIYAATTSCDLAIDGNACEIAAGHALRIDAGESFTVASRLGTAIVASIRSRRPGVGHGRRGWRRERVLASSRLRTIVRSTTRQRGVASSHGRQHEISISGRMGNAAALRQDLCQELKLDALQTGLYGSPAEGEDLMSTGRRSPCPRQWCP